MVEFAICRQRLIDRELKFVEFNKDGEVWVDLAGEYFLLFKTIETNIQVKCLDGIIKTLRLYDIKNGIQLYTDNTSSSVKNNLGTIDENIELICTNELTCNIMKHKYQPQMQKCSKQQVGAAIKLHMYSLPQFASDDVVVKWMNWRKGDVIAICPKKCQNKLNDCGKCCDGCNFRIVV
jgi:DNA-directed RNA polymerase subunit H (RpoH/RPB5)